MSYQEKLGKSMTIKEANKYMDDAVKSFFNDGIYTKKMGVDRNQLVNTRSSFTSRPSNFSKAIKVEREREREMLMETLELKP